MSQLDLAHFFIIKGHGPPGILKRGVAGLTVQGQIGSYPLKGPEAKRKTTYSLQIRHWELDLLF